MTLLADLIDEDYGGDANYKEIVELCLATIKLFNCLEGEDVELKKIVSLLFWIIINWFVNTYNMYIYVQ